MACITSCNPFTFIENLRLIATAKSALVIRYGFSMNLKGMQSMMHAMTSSLTIEPTNSCFCWALVWRFTSALVSSLRLLVENLKRVQLVRTAKWFFNSNQTAAFGTSQTAEVSTCTHAEIANHGPGHACHPGVRGCADQALYSSARHPASYQSIKLTDCITLISRNPSSASCPECKS